MPWEDRSCLMVPVVPACALGLAGRQTLARPGPVTPGAGTGGVGAGHGRGLGLSLGDIDGGGRECHSRSGQCLGDGAGRLSHIDSADGRGHVHGAGGQCVGACGRDRSASARRGPIMPVTPALRRSGSGSRWMPVIPALGRSRSRSR